MDRRKNIDAMNRQNSHAASTCVSLDESKERFCHSP